MIEWVGENDWLWWPLAVFSMVSLLTAFVAAPWAVSQMSADYFMANRDRGKPFANLHPVPRWAGIILKNLLGALLVILGLILLALPGQGLLTILAGLVLMNFPGKLALELWIIRMPMVLKAANWLRGKAGRAPLQVPERS
jgi:hypothetical protein